MRGLRVGTGPRGPYVAGGRYGLYFHQSLKAGGTPNSSTPHAEGSPLYCTHCGSPIGTGNLFCTQCGARLENAETGTVFEPDLSAHRHPLFWMVVGLVGLVVLITFLRQRPSQPTEAGSEPHPATAATLPHIPDFKPGTVIRHGPDRIMELVLRDCGRPSQVRQNGNHMIWEYSRKGYNLSWALPVTAEDRATHEDGPWLLAIERRRDGSTRDVTDPRAYSRPEMPCIRRAVHSR